MLRDRKDPLPLLVSFDLDDDPKYCFKHVLLLSLRKRPPDRLIGLGTLCQFNFDRAERPSETLYDADCLNWIADALSLLKSEVFF